MGRQLLVGGQMTGVATTAAPQRTVALSTERQRRRRSPAYLDAVRELDAGGRTIAPDRLAAVKDAVAAEFPDGSGTWPLGWVAKCFLGPPFEVHLLDLSGQIVRHFKVGEALPGDLERARRIAASGQYSVIEVFSDRLVAIAADGSTAVMA